jgi:hypothetical protein
MAVDWTLTQILATARRLSGLRSTTQVSDADATTIINRVYSQILPVELMARDLQLFHTLTLAVGVDLYDLDTDIVEIFGDILLDPRRTITGFTAPSTITVAGDVTAKYAVDVGVTVASSTSNDGGYVIASSSHAGGTTTIVLSEITITTETAAGTMVKTGDQISELKFYRDQKRFFDNYEDQADAITNQKPEALLLWGNDNDTATDKDRQIWVRPHSDDLYTVKMPVVKKPQDLSGSVTPVYENWGWCLAYMSAIHIIQEFGGGDVEKVTELKAFFDYHRTLVDRATIRQMTGTRSTPSF